MKVIPPYTKEDFTFSEHIEVIVKEIPSSPKYNYICLDQFKECNQWHPEQCVRCNKICESFINHQDI